MRYRITCPLVLARGKDGRTHHRYQGEIIDWLPDDQLAHCLELGLVEPHEVFAGERAKANTTPVVPEPTTAPNTTKPPQSASARARTELTRECALTLDQIELPLTASTPKACAALLAHGHTFSNNIVAAAVKYRRQHDVPEKA